MSQDDTKDDSPEKIEIFSTDDEKIKSIGELLSNDSSREILQLLFKKELTANQIAQETDVSLQLVKYHLNKMQDMGIAKISKVGKNIKGQDMKFYKATKFAVVIVPSAVSERAKESKLLVRSFKTIYRFAGIGIAGVAAWFTTLTLQQPQTVVVPGMEQDGGMEEFAMTAPAEESRQAVSEPSSAVEESSPTVEEPIPTDVTMEDMSEGTEAITEPVMEQDAGADEDAFLGAVPESEPEPSEKDVTAEEETLETIPESSESPPETVMEDVVDESLSLAERAEEAAEAVATSSGATASGGGELFWPIIVTLAVIGAGLILEFAYRRRRSKQTQTA